MRSSGIRFFCFVSFALSLAACDSDDAGELGQGDARVRVNVVTRMASPGTTLKQTISLDAVELCTDAGCESVPVHTPLALSATENDTGVAVVDLSVPAGRLTRLTLVGAASSEVPIRSGEVALTAPVVLEDSTRTELFVALDPVDGGAAARFVATAAAPAEFGGAMVFEPGRDSRYALPSGFSLSVAGASASGRRAAAPTVYTVSEYDVGGAGAVYNIYPGDGVMGEAELRIPLDPSRFPPGASGADYVVSVDGQIEAAEVEGQTLVVRTQRGGLVRVASTRASYETDTGEVVADGADPAAGGRVRVTCASALAGKRTEYRNQLLNTATYALKTTVCESADPELHIILYDMTSSSSNIRFPRSYAGNSEYNLRELSQHAAGIGAIGAVNGYFWSGDEGTSGGLGTWNGTVYMDGGRYSTYTATREALLAFTPRLSTGVRGEVFFKDAGDATTSLTLGGVTYDDYVIGSRTSLLADGVCTPSPGGNDVASTALGYGGSILMMASTTSGEESTSYELCQAMLAMGMDEAVQLDGGPSAAIYWRDTVLNPLTGLYYFKYGSYRDIMYGVAIDPTP